MDADCIRCSRIITKRMHALQCDGCEMWQHRKCNTGVTPEQYRAAMQGTLELEWKCRSCTDQINSTILPGAGVPPELDVTASPIRNLNHTYIVRSDDVPTEEDPDVEPEAEPADVPMEEEPDVVPAMEDRSFDVDGREFHQPTAPLDDSLRDRPLDDVILEDAPLTFEVVEGGSIRGARKLVSSSGYTYTRRNAKDGRVYWTCSVRNKKLKCPASVKQFGEIFTPSYHGHQHPADPGALKKVTIAAKVKQIARANVFRPAREIVESTMKTQLTREDFALPKPDLLTRTANRHRENLRPSKHQPLFK